MRHPRDVLGGLRDEWEMRRDVRRPQPGGVEAQPLATVLDQLGRALSADAPSLLADPALRTFEDEIQARIDGAPANPYPAEFNASRTLGRLCWLAVRLLEPRVVVETGVAAGLTSSYILVALEANGRGELHSIDPILGGPERRRAIAWLVPQELQGRHTLHRGRSRRLLARVARNLGGVDVFVQDGLHTTPTVAWELAAVGRRLGPRSAVLADDVERGPSFADWARSHPLRYWSLVATEYPNHFCGVALT